MADELLKVYRTKVVNITLPKPDSLPWIDFTLQEVYYNAKGEAVQLVDDIDRYARRVDRVALELVTFTDPVTQQVKQLHVASIGEAIKQAVINWIIEDGEKQYDPKTGLITDADK